MQVKDCMCSKVECVKPTTTVSDVAKIMRTNHIGCVPVCNDSKNIVGIVTDRDLILRCIASEKDCKSTPVSEIMTTDVKTVNSTTDIKEATNIMCECQIRRVPVLDNYQLVGIITIGDLVNNTGVSSSEVANTVSKVCNCHNSQNAE